MNIIEFKKGEISTLVPTQSILNITGIATKRNITIYVNDGTGSNFEMILTSTEEYEVTLNTLKETLINNKTYTLISFT